MVPREVEIQSASTPSSDFCDIKLSEKREDSFVSESITCGVARVRDQQEELGWDAADVIMDSPDGNILLPLVSGGVSRPKRDPGTRPNRGFSGRTPSPLLSDPPSCEIPLERVGEVASLKLQEHGSTLHSCDIVPSIWTRLTFGYKGHLDRSASQAPQTTTEILCHRSVAQRTLFSKVSLLLSLLFSTDA